MATYSSIHAWRILWTEEPGGLPSTGSQRVGHDWSNLACTHTLEVEGLPWQLSSKEPNCQCRRHRFSLWIRRIPWSKKWQPTPGFLPGKFHGQRSLAGYSPCGHKEWDTTEQLTLSLSTKAIAVLISTVIISFLVLHFKQRASWCLGDREDANQPSASCRSFTGWFPLHGSDPSLFFWGSAEKTLNS